MIFSEKANAIVGQSGGPTAAINATLAGVISAALDSDKIDVLYGARNGVEGMLREDVIDLSDIFGASDKNEKLERLSATPSAALGSCRVKLPPVDDAANNEKYIKLFNFFKKMNIRYFFYIGGNDSMDTVSKLSAVCDKFDWDMNFVGVPKTIDNDLDVTDHTPGYGSCAKFIATVMSEMLCDTAVYTVKAVTIVEIMGRDTGWLTAASALSAVNTGIGPDYIYLPETDFDYERFFKDVENAFSKHPNVVIAVSEGLHFADGRLVGEGMQSGATDVFGHKYLDGTAKALELAVKERFGCKVRSVELNLPQRCASHIASLTDIKESFGVGSAAVESALNGDSDCMMCIKREGNGEKYAVSYKSVAIELVANRIKYVPDDFINEEGNNVTDKCIEYMLPLVQGCAPYFTQNGIPEFLILSK
ncbi:MAG: 6-phosphofructokinase [Clostridia bacterium]|nr:6-phosphofructokinase [Clostridia bacterium]MBQ8743431.1 6-phosphofructokinase [Clostridia bacterium]